MYKNTVNPLDLYPSNSEKDDKLVDKYVRSFSDTSSQIHYSDSSSSRNEFIDVINNKLFRKKAITSYSMILYTIQHNEIYYLLGQVRDTIPFKEYIKCDIKDNELLHYISHMSLNEKRRILHEPFLYLVNDVILNRSGKTYKSSQMYQEKFETNILNHRAILTDSSIGIKENPWIFPKGKKEHNETDIQCALRELEEETRIDKSKVIVMDINPLEETYFGLDGQLYKTIYYTGFISIEDFKNMIHDIESKYIYTEARVSISEEILRIQWHKYDDAIDKLDNSKRYILRLINTQLFFTLHKTNTPRRYSI